MCGMCFFALSLFLSNITRKRYFLSNITRKRELLSYSYSLLYNFRYRCLMVLTMPNGSGVVLSSFRRNWGKKSDHFATECVDRFWRVVCEKQCDFLQTRNKWCRVCKGRGLLYVLRSDPDDDRCGAVPTGTSTSSDEYRRIDQLALYRRRCSQLWTRPGRSQQYLYLT